MLLISNRESWMAAAAFAAAFVLALGATPLARRAAIRLNVLDVPKDERRVHTRPVPMLGGVAIALSFSLCALIFSHRGQQLYGILVGGALMTRLGALDDKFDLPPVAKLIAQFAISAIPVLAGLRINFFTDVFHLFSGGGRVYLGVFSIPVTMIWIVALTNAVNFIDGLDGLACGVSLISGVSIFLIALKLGDANAAILIACLCGACLGFLPYNINPARIFMGDAGALFLGYALSTMSITGLFKWYSFVSFGLPLLILGIPVFDIVFAFFRRLFHGKNPMRADRGHVHQRLIDLGMTQRQIVAIFYAVSATLGLLSVFIAELPLARQLIAFVVAGAAFALSVVFFLRNRRSHREKEETARLEAEAKTGSSLPGGPADRPDGDGNGGGA